MPETSGLPDWITDVGHDLDEQSAIYDTPERRMLRNVEEAARSRGRYHDLVGGEPGDVPGEFDDAAAQVLEDELDASVLDLMSYVADRQLLATVLAELREEADPADYPILDEIGDKLRARAAEAETGVVETAQSSEAARRAISDKALTSVEEELRAGEYEAGSQIDITYLATNAYHRRMGELIGEGPRKQLWDRLRTDRYDWQQKENDENWVRLNLAVSRAKLERFCSGRTTFLLSGENRHRVITGGRERGEIFADVSGHVVQQVGDALSASYPEQYEMMRPAEVELSLAAVTDGLMLGAHMAQSDVDSPADLERLLGESNRELQLHNPNTRYVKIRTDHTSDHMDAARMGYILGLLDRGDVVGMRIVASMRIAMRSIEDEALLAAFVEALRAQAPELSGHYATAMSFLTGDRDISQVDDAEYARLGEELRRIESEAQRRGIRNRMFLENSASVGERHRQLEFSTWAMDSLGRVRPFVRGLEDGLTQREFSYRTVEALIDQDGLLPKGEGGRALTWEDAEAALDVIVLHGGLEDSHRVERMLKTESLEREQRRLIAMLYCSHLFTVDSGNAYAKARVIDRLYQAGHLSAGDIVATHNATLAVVEGTNRACMQMYPGETPPCRFYTVIDALATLREETTSRTPYGSSPPRTGPFRDKSLISGEVIARYPRGLTKGAPLYYTGQEGNLNGDAVRTYTLSGERPPSVSYGQLRERVQGYVTDLNVAVGRFGKLLGAEKYADETFESATSVHRNDARRVSDLLQRSFSNDVVEAARVFGWADRAQTILDQVGAISDDVVSDQSELARAQSEYRELALRCGSTLLRLDEMDRDTEQHQVWEITARRAKRADADGVRDNTVQNLQTEGVGEDILVNLRRLNLTKEGDRQTMRMTLEGLLETSTSRVETAVADLSRRITGIEDITEEVVSRRIGDDGTVILSKVSRDSSGRTVLLEDGVDIAMVGGRNREGEGVVNALLLEADLVSALRRQLHQASDTLREELDRHNGPRGVPYYRGGIVDDYNRRVSTQNSNLIRLLQARDIEGGREIVRARLQEVWRRTVQDMRDSDASIMDGISEVVPAGITSKMFGMIDR